MDKDGVINEKLDDDYVKNWSEFSFINRSIKAISRLSMLFGRIIIVTNQRGVGKGLMNEEDLKTIHQNMIEVIKIILEELIRFIFVPKFHTRQNAGSLIREWVFK